MRRARRQAAELLLALVFAAASSLNGAANYPVGGIVVDSGSHAPLAHVRVSLAPVSARDQKLEQVTKPDGRFSFVVSQAGKYELRIAKPGYPSQGYRQAGFASVESSIVVRDGQDTRNIVFEANRGSAITGQIKDEDSEPVGHALVSIFQSSIAGGERKILQRGQMRANAAGEFRFSNLPRGNYYVCAMGRPWFANSLIQFQDIQESVDGSQQLTKAPGQDTVQSEPSAGQPTGPDQSVPKYSPDPDRRGTAFLTTFYPRAQTVEEASPVRLDTGSETQVSITLPLTKAVSVKGTISLPGGMSEGRAELFKKIYDQYMSFLEQPVPKDGTFQFENVPAGSYEIVAISESASGASSWTVSQEVEVGAGDMEVSLRPAPLGSVSGHVLFEGERPESTATLYVVLRNEKGSLVRDQVDPEGKFSLSRLPVGRYEVMAGSADYIAAYSAGPSGERLPLILEIASGETVRRDLVLTRAVSVIEGTAEKAGVPRIGAFVLLMPKNPSQRWAYRVDQTDSDGSYRLAAIPSGDYFLIALSEGGDVAYRDAKVAAILAKAAKLVHIEPGDRLNMKVDVVGTATLNLPVL